MPQTRVNVSVNLEKYKHWFVKVYSLKYQFSHLHGEFPNVHEGLDVLFCDMFPGHRRKGGLSLLFQVQLPAEACYKHNETAWPHQSNTSTPDCLKQS